MWAEVQNWAEELGRLDATETARKITLEEKIVAFEFSLLKEFNGKAYFPLTKNFNGKFEYEEFYDVFIDKLLKVVRSYNPDNLKKATFTTYLRFHLENGLIDLIKKLKKRGIIIIITEITQEDDDGAEYNFDPMDQNWDFTEYIESEFDIFRRLAPIIAERKKQERHLSKSKKSFFEGFFTFDIAKSLRIDNLIEKSEVCEENALLFFIMELVVLKYLMQGRFAHMCNIAENALKDEKLFKRRGAAIEICYCLTHPTVVTKGKAYKTLFKSVAGLEGTK